MNHKRPNLIWKEIFLWKWIAVLCVFWIPAVGGTVHLNSPTEGSVVVDSRPVLFIRILQSYPCIWLPWILTANSPRDHVSSSSFSNPDSASLTSQRPLELTDKSSLIWISWGGAEQTLEGCSCLSIVQIHASPNPALTNNITFIPAMSLLYNSSILILQSHASLNL